MADTNFETLKYFIDRVLYMCVTFLLYTISGLMMDLPREMLNWYDFEDDYCQSERTQTTTGTVTTKVSRLVCLTSILSQVNTFGV